MATVSVLAEAGLSECAGAPGVPACKELNDGLLLMFMLFVGLPLLFFAAAFWILAARSATRSIRRTALSRVRRRAWSAAAWLLPIVGPAAWGIKHVISPAPPAPSPPDTEWSPAPRAPAKQSS